MNQYKTTTINLNSVFCVSLLKSMVNQNHFANSNILNMAFLKVELLAECKTLIKCNYVIQNFRAVETHCMPVKSKAF